MKRITIPTMMQGDLMAEAQILEATVEIRRKTRSPSVVEMAFLILECCPNGEWLK